MVEKLLTEIANSFYNEVVKDFQEIKEDEIEIKYDKFIPIAGFTIIDTIKHELSGEIEFKPTLFIGPMFLMFRYEDKEAIIAHELGHYMYDKNLSHKRIDSRMRHNQELWNLESALNNNLPNPFNEHKTKRLKQFRIAKEIYADKEAAKAGYGRKILNLYIQNASSAITDWDKEKLKASIMSLWNLLEK